VLAFAASEDLVDKLVALVAVLSEQRFNPLEGRGLERLESKSQEHAAHGVDHPLPVPHLGGEEIARALREKNVHVLP
jgi:hypothetical protein